MNKLYKITAFSLMSLAIIFLSSIVLAAPTTNPPAGGVIQVTPSATNQGAITIDANGVVNLTDALPRTSGGTACSDNSSLAVWLNCLSAAKSGSNSDITSLTPSTLDGPVDLSLGNATKNVILNGNVGIGATSSLSEKLQVNGRILATGSGYTANPSGPIFGQYTSTIGYVQAPSGGRIDIWTGGSSAIATFNDDLSANFNGLVTAPSPTSSSPSNQVATKGYVDVAVAQSGGSNSNGWLLLPGTILSTETAYYDLWGTGTGDYSYSHYSSKFTPVGSGFSHGIGSTSSNRGIQFKKPGMVLGGGDSSASPANHTISSLEFNAALEHPSGAEVHIGIRDPETSNLIFSISSHVSYNNFMVFINASTPYDTGIPKDRSYRLWRIDRDGSTLKVYADGALRVTINNADASRRGGWLAAWITTSGSSPVNPYYLIKAARASYQ